MLSVRSNDNNRLPDFYTVAVVSRRSRHRAGTRYKRRGVDAEGHVANYVESEQVCFEHFLIKDLSTKHERTEMVCDS